MTSGNPGTMYSRLSCLAQNGASSSLTVTSKLHVAMLGASDCKDVKVEFAGICGSPGFSDPIEAMLQASIKAQSSAVSVSQTIFLKISPLSKTPEKPLQSIAPLVATWSKTWFPYEMT